MLPDSGSRGAPNDLLAGLADLPSTVERHRKVVAEAFLELLVEVGQHDLGDRQEIDFSLMPSSGTQTSSTSSASGPTLPSILWAMALASAVKKRVS